MKFDGHSWCPEDESKWLWWSPGFLFSATSRQKCLPTQWISSTSAWCAAIDIHVLQRVNANDFDDPQFLSLVQPAGSHLWFRPKCPNNCITVHFSAGSHSLCELWWSPNFSSSAICPILWFYLSNSLVFSLTELQEVFKCSAAKQIKKGKSFIIVWHSVLT